MIEFADIGGGVGVVTLCRPDAANAMTVPMVDALRAELARIEADRSIRVVVLAAQGKVFCAGLDLKEIRGEDAPRDPIAFMHLQERFAGLMQEVAQARFPVIAAIGGAAVGAGMGLALAADIRVVAPNARFLVGAVKIGLSAGECGISYHLPRLIGAGRAFEIMLTGRPVGAEEAVAIGLASAAASEGPVNDQAIAMARIVAQNSDYAIKHTKQVMRANLDAPSLAGALELENHVQCVALLTEDFREACTAFEEKRPPLFAGR
ncbi:enoyl-CoA hydratase/isomerase family protein [Novosphingobium sp. MMS21-SN21R]|uniref:enoyl-CoA hydratase/isomerase family protein n=1 Tax=Novosphingobium sp. MMS21-SN21R TaxID=2969298 RepID=UPI0028858F5D|nr:enoyl-CoA hydratase/isomerase family protein [Novosphingobium sp. MMS21-SN21R]MDT0509350.1 enoyl-CoA hydratase/isomerase family protein [Novosphingobium sp. MMS21-SN21R]